ncbi:hypothetical protein [Streptomyces sp. NPDC002265]|uniref:HAAS signaling domain-containing protein n=1 Tax=Streptomyces sp. NPDC002265 TaxID=3154415 RepID=UPI0033295925
MKDTTSNTEQQMRAAFLAAVERETTTLPADRRAELLADLAEHIDTALAERSSSIEQVVAELGDPRVIAASALREDGGAVPAPARRPRNPLTPLLVLALSVPVAALNQVLFDNGLISGVVRIIGVVLLCRSVFWTGAQKTAGSMVTFALPAVIGLTALHSNSLDGVPSWLLDVLLMGLPLGGCVWLWSARRRSA